MSQFPRNNADILALARRMVSGLELHPDIFTHGNPAELLSVIESFQEATFRLQEAQAAAKCAAIAKAEVLDRLQQEMKGQIRQAQVDTAAAPQQMNLIGINDRKKNAATLPPQQPGNLTLEYLGENSLTLHWRKSTYSTRRPVRHYLIQKRRMDNRCPWQLAAITFDNHYRLGESDFYSDEATRFRVIAANENGSSCPSNEVTTARAALPTTAIKPQIAPEPAAADKLAVAI